MPKIRFVPDGPEVEVPVDTSILEASNQCGGMVGSACGGVLACSTCHVIVDPAWFDRLDTPSDDEEDMLDLAFGLTPTSRLGCQIIITEDLDGLTVTLPPETCNLLLG